MTGRYLGRRSDRAATGWVPYGVGYDALSAFNAAFRECTGQTPTSDRASFRA